ncbi:MAG: VanW family protein [Chloroflexaceae bacterium]|nr:VanW family protein [Chloroflexaceae bacterium]
MTQTLQRVRTAKQTDIVTATQPVSSLLRLDIPMGYALTRMLPTEQNPYRLFVPPSRYFEQTGHNVWGPFLAFYEAHGGLPLFGLPLTEVLYERGARVQYFERARFALPEDQSDAIQLTPIGQMLAETQVPPTALAVREARQGDRRQYVEETGHTISALFADFWSEHQGEHVFGNPISEAFLTTIDDGQQAHPAMVQYFEQARLEYLLPNGERAAEIRIGLIGGEYATRQISHPVLFEPVAPIRQLSIASAFVGAYSSSAHNVRIAASQLDGVVIPPQQAMSFLAEVGEVSVEAGYASGGAIINGEIAEVVGGGICHVSTILYRAALEAGLKIIERHPHTLALDEFSDSPGLDSAVFTPNLDLIWYNDTDGPISIASQITDDGYFTIALWGYDDGRTVLISDAAMTYGSKPAESIWRYDEDLPKREVRQIAYGTPSLSVLVERNVWDTTGETLYSDEIVSHYEGLHDVFLYGPGVDPACERGEKDCREQELEALLEDCERMIPKRVRT